MADDTHSSTHTRQIAQQFAAALADHLGIAHQVAGRVRLKLDGEDAPSALGALGADGAALRAALAAQPGVRAVRINPLARSCVVDYDNRAIPDAAWPDWLAGRQTDAAALLRDLLVAALSAPSLPSTRHKEKTP